MMSLPGEELPESVAILGAGYICCELAGVLHTLGVQTDLFVRRERPLRGFDSYIVESLVQEMKNTGLNLHTHKVPAKLEETEQGITIHFEDGSTHTASQVIWQLVAVQMIEGLQLEKAGVTLNERGFIRLMNTRTQSLTESTLLEMSPVKRN